MKLYNLILKAESIIDCEPEIGSIDQAIKTLYSKDFKNILSAVKNPYGEGNATEKIIKILRDTIIPKEIKKEFYDL